MDAFLDAVPLLATLGVVGGAVWVRWRGRLRLRPTPVRLTGSIANPETWLPEALRRAGETHSAAQPAAPTTSPATPRPALPWRHRVQVQQSTQGFVVHGELTNGDGEDVLVVCAPYFSGLATFPPSDPLEVVVDWQSYRSQPNPWHRMLFGRLPLAEAVTVRARLIAEIKRQAADSPRGWYPDRSARDRAG